MLDDKTYQFADITVRSYNNNMYVSLSAGSSVEEVDDIGDVTVASGSDCHEGMSNRRRGNWYFAVVPQMAVYGQLLKKR